MKIGLNAGHTLSGAGSGTIGVISESAETRRVCNRLTELLTTAGVQVVPFRTNTGSIFTESSSNGKCN